MARGTLSSGTGKGVAFLFPGQWPELGLTGRSRSTDLVAHIALDPRHRVKRVDGSVSVPLGPQGLRQLF